METPLQCAARLIAALDDLVTQEGMYLRAGSFGLAAEVRERAEPVVTRLVELSHFPGVTDMRAKVAAIVERSAHHATILEEKISEFRSEMRRTDQARHRTSQLAPAYAPRQSLVKNQRFIAAG